jgi:hypothetical protein
VIDLNPHTLTNHTTFHCLFSGHTWGGVVAVVLFLMIALRWDLSNAASDLTGDFDVPVLCKVD